MFDKIDFKSGRICWSGFELNETVSLEEQIWSLKLDILLVDYGDNYCLDFGWLPEFDIIEGAFRLMIVKDENFQNPIFIRRTKELSELHSLFIEAINFVEDEMK